VNLATTLAEQAERGGWSDRVAYAGPAGTVSHGQVHRGAAQAAAVLAELGVARGDRVLIALEDSVEFVWSFLASLWLGAIAVPVDPELPPGDHASSLAHAEPRVVVCARELVDRFQEAAATLAPATLTGEMAGAASVPAAAVGGEAPAYGQYTAGTTGRPKLALHRHDDPLVYHRTAGSGAFGIGPDDVLLSASRMHVAFGLGNSVFFPLLSGACALLHPGGAQPGAVAETAARRQPTLLFAVPTFYARLLEALPASPLTALRAAVSAGEPLTPALAGRIRRWAGCPVLDTLVSTEVGHAFCANTPAAARDGTLGRALEGYEVRIADAAGRDLPEGTQGLLWVRGPTLLIDYWNEPEATARALTGGWLRTGDLATLDGEGFIRHHGRADDVELVRGIAVSALEVERVLAAHIGVAEVAVAAVRDELGASSLHAFVVPTDPAKAGAALGDSVIALARERLASHKVPQAVTFVPELPRTPHGRLRRFLLREGGVEPLAAGRPG